MLLSTLVGPNRKHVMEMMHIIDDKNTDVFVTHALIKKFLNYLVMTQDLLNI